MNFLIDDVDKNKEVKFSLRTADQDDVALLANGNCILVVSTEGYIIMDNRHWRELERLGFIIDGDEVKVF